MSSQEDDIGENDLIFYSSGEKIYSGGFSIDSSLMREGEPVMQSVQTGNAFDGIFGKNYVVPPMWFLSPHESLKQVGGEKTNHECIQVIEEDLHEKLLKILEETRKETKKRTAKLREKRKKTTRRNI